MLSPPYARARVLQLKPATLELPRAFSPYDLDVGIDPTAGELGALAQRVGLAGEIELIVTGPSESSFFRHVYRRGLPSVVTFTPKEGGKHLVTIREVTHNKWWGSLAVEVLGESVDPRVRT